MNFDINAHHPLNARQIESFCANAIVRARSVLTMNYMDAQMRLGHPLNTERKYDSAYWSPRTAPGEMIWTTKNILTYRRK